MRLYVLPKISRLVGSSPPAANFMYCVILNRWGKSRKENKIMKLSGNGLQQKTETQSWKLKNQIKTFVGRFCSAEGLVLPA